MSTTYTITRGQNWTAEFEPDDDQVITDITGWTIVFALATVKGGTPDVTVNATITSAVAGTFTAVLTAAQTAALTDRSYFWDAWRTNSGNKDPIASGTITVISSANLP